MKITHEELLSEKEPVKPCSVSKEIDKQECFFGKYWRICSIISGTWHALPEVAFLNVISDIFLWDFQGFQNYFFILQEHVYVPASVCKSGFVTLICGILLQLFKRLSIWDYIFALI